jgi:hypothetical protein
MHPPGPENGEARAPGKVSRFSEKLNSYDTRNIADSPREGKPRGEDRP